MIFPVTEATASDDGDEVPTKHGKDVQSQGPERSKPTSEQLPQQAPQPETVAQPTRFDADKPAPSSDITSQWPATEPEAPAESKPAKPRKRRLPRFRRSDVLKKPASKSSQSPFTSSESEVGQNIAAVLAAYPGERLDVIDAREQQMKTDDQKEPRSHRFLPVPSIRSEPLVGLTIGGSLTYAYRRPEATFNSIYLLLLARVSTRRVHEYRGDLEVRDLLGRQELFQFGMSMRLDPVFPYYGVANHTDLRGTKFDARLYTSRVNTTGGYFRYQHRIIASRRGVWRALVGYAFYRDKIRPSPGSLLYRERPQDLGATRRGTLQAGVTWDSRDNTWNPSRGSAHDLNITVATPWLGSTSTWARLSGNLRFFAPLGIPEIVFATRIGIDGLVGATENLPLTALGQFGDLPGREGFGGATIGRGFIRRRFIGRYKALWSSELRFDAFEVTIRDRPFALGLKGFLDIARVSDKLVPEFRDFELSGGPGLFVVINRFAVVRLDVGISREFLAMYVLGSHAF